MSVTGPKCHCLIRHAHTKKEREALGKRLDYFRSIADTKGAMLVLAQLDTDRCLALDKGKSK